MKVRSGRQLNLPAVGKLLVQRQHFTQNSQVLVEHMVLVRFTEVPAFIAQAAQLGVAFKDQRMNPGEVEPDLQVAEVAHAKAAQRFAGTVSAGAAPQVQFGKAWKRPDHGVRVGHKEVVEQEETIA